MNQIYLDLLLHTILEQFHSEEEFCTNYLGVELADWQAWKSGANNLSPELNQKIKNLFSDYEWMLSQKVIRQAFLFPEKRQTAVAEYREMKTVVAQKWIESGMGKVELIPYKNKNDEENHEYLDLRVTMDYAQWGYDDILSFRLPAHVQTQIEGSQTQTALLDWVSENLTETYTSFEE
ncbi:hypothetical protein NRIC_33230 [Enterococcus florum]|uniref:Uncharacterized protein n=1 Tax=Enterococcus florum TaxID=2480627 RepID=A0A4P5PIF1_9ENTE|nr:hypothetical protein [Enterococcus florum]GCF95432.1 hypothetical protein NRIC_33230 [Enterococcus florum]